jgi:hypothetical protein
MPLSWLLFLRHLTFHHACIRACTVLASAWLPRLHLCRILELFDMQAFPGIHDLSLTLRSVFFARCFVMSVFVARCALQVAERVLATLMKLPSALQSLYLNVLDPSPSATIPTGPLFELRSCLLHSQARPEPLYPQLSYLGFQGLFLMTPDGNRGQEMLMCDASYETSPDGTVQVYHSPPPLPAI